MHSSGMDDGLPERMVVDPGQRGVVGLGADLVLERGAVCLGCWYGRPPPASNAVEFEFPPNSETAVSVTVTMTVPTESNVGQFFSFNTDHKMSN